MFDDPLQPGNIPQSGPLPGSPLPPLVTGDVPMPQNMPQSMASPVSPERTPGLPPIPMNLPPMTGGGGPNWKKIFIFAFAVIVLIGGGVLAAMLLFPATNQNENAEENANLTNTVTNANTNTNLNRNTNRANSNLNLNVNFNRNTNGSVNANGNGNGNTNISGNLNGVVNFNLNTNTNTNLSSNANGNSNININGSSNTNNTSNSNINGNLTLDTDKDGLVDYLEDWLHTNKNKADSDGDGYQDGTEITNGYSPLGKGKFTVPGLKVFCAGSALVTQYGFTTADSTNFCSIGGDVLASIQVMVASPTITQDLDAQLSTSCKTFTAIDQASCISVTKSVIVDYETSDSTT